MAATRRRKTYLPDTQAKLLGVLKRASASSYPSSNEDGNENDKITSPES